MNNSAYRFTLDFHKQRSQVSIPIKMYDTATKFYISLTDGGVPYQIAEGCRAVFCGTKADGHVLVHDCTIESNKVVYTFREQTATCKGIVDCEIRLYGLDDKQITSAPFMMVVGARVANNETIANSTNDYNDLVDKVESGETERESAERERNSNEYGKDGTGNTSGRVYNESLRVSAETQRNINEYGEDGTGNTSGRVYNESVREKNEKARVAAETERQNNTYLPITKSEIMGSTIYSSKIQDLISFAKLWVSSLSVLESLSVNDTLSVVNKISTTYLYADDITATKNLLVKGNLTVSGKTTTVDQETLAVKDNVIITNSGGTELTGYDNSGFAVCTGEYNSDGKPRAYGIVYSHYDKVAKVGFGYIDEDSNGGKAFKVYSSDNVKPIATRKKIADGNIPVWNDNAAAFVDSKKNPDDFLLSQQPLDSPSADPFYNNKYPFSVYGVDAFGGQGLMGATHKSIGNTLVRRDTLGYIHAKAPLFDDAVTNKKYVDAADIVLKNEIQVLERKVENLEGATLKYIEDSSVAYKKSVPANAAPYASIEKIGGMTYRVEKKIKDIIQIPTQRLQIYGDGGIGGYGVSGNTPLTFEAGKYYGISYTGELPFYTVVDGNYNHIFEYETVKCFTETVTADSWEIYFEGESDAYVEGAELYSDVSVTIYEFEYVLEDTKVTALKSVGANLFDINNAITDSGSFVISGNSIVWTPKQDAIDVFAFSYWLDVESNTDYTISVKGDAALFGVYLYTDWIYGTRIVNKKFEGGATKYVTVNSGNNTRILVGFYSSKALRDETTETISEIMIVKGSNLTEYKPYSAEPIDTLAIPEAVQPKHGVSKSIYDYIEWEESGARKSHKCVEKMEFDGTEQWTIETGNTYARFGLPLTNALTAWGAGSTNLLSNYYVVGAAGYSGTPCISIDAKGYLYIQDSTFATVVELKEHLADLYESGKPLAIVYALAEPIETDISDILSSDNFIKVEGAGTIVAVNEAKNENAVPTTIEYVTKL